MAIFLRGVMRRIAKSETTHNPFCRGPLLHALLKFARWGAKVCCGDDILTQAADVDSPKASGRKSAGWVNPGLAPTGFDLCGGVAC